MRWTEKDIPDLSGKLALVTGANRGLGFIIASALAGAGAGVVLACRNVQKADDAIARIRQQLPHAVLAAMALDVADLASIHRFADAFNAKFQKLDLLLHNAAAIMVPQGKTRDGFETHLGTNHLGPFALTGLLLPRLNSAPAARIVNMSSIAHRMTRGLDTDDPGLSTRPYTEMDAYGRSKLATLLFTRELNRHLQASGSKTIAVSAHPGYTATNPDIGGFFMRLATRLFAQAPECGALPALHAATGTEVKGGDYFGPSGFKELRGVPTRVASSAESCDAELAKRLWTLSESLTGVRYPRI